MRLGTFLRPRAHLIMQFRTNAIKVGADAREAGRGKQFCRGGGEGFRKFARRRENLALLEGCACVGVPLNIWYP